MTWAPCGRRGGTTGTGRKTAPAPRHLRGRCALAAFTSAVRQAMHRPSTSPGTHPPGPATRRAWRCTCGPDRSCRRPGPSRGVLARCFRPDAPRSRQRMRQKAAANRSYDTPISYRRAWRTRRGRCAAPYAVGLVAFTECPKHVMLQSGGARDSGERSASAESGLGRSCLPPSHPRRVQGSERGFGCFEQLAGVIHPVGVASARPDAEP